MRGPIRTFEENFMAFLLLEKDALKGDLYRKQRIAANHR